MEDDGKGGQMLLASDQLRLQMQPTFVRLIHHLPSTGCRVVVAGQMQATFVHLIVIFHLQAVV
jgi:hypothetical protein